jgi:maltose-binding protein MalE
MSRRRQLWATLSFLGLLCILGFSLVMAVEARVAPQKDTSANKDASYLTHLPLVASDFGIPKVTIWTWWDPNLLPEYQNVVNEFNTAHPDMEIRLVFIPNMYEAFPKAVQAGIGPDIVVYPNDPIGAWGSAGYLVTLDPWVDMSYLTANFVPTAVNGVIFDEQIWGIPDTQEGIALVYNREVISDTMIPEPNNFAGMLALAEQFRVSNPDKYYLCNQGLGGIDAYHAGPIYFGYGLDEYGGYLDEDGTVYMTTTEAISAAEWILDLRAFSPDVTDYGICRNMLVNGEAAIWWTGPWAIPDLQNTGIDYGIAPMGSPFVGIRTFMLTSNGVDRGNAEAAIYVMKYFASFEIQKRLTMANLTIPANKAALNDPDIQAIYEIAQFGESLNLGIPMGNNVYTPCQWGPVGDATLAIWDGSQTPVQAMNAAQTAIMECVAPAPLLAGRP